MIQTILTIFQTILGVLLILVILLQAKGTGLGAAFGGEGEVFHTKRGAEKRLHQITIIVAILFFGVALAQSLT